jgi:hypothetical protein
MRISKKNEMSENNTNIVRQNWEEADLGNVWGG